MGFKMARCAAILAVATIAMVASEAEAQPRNADDGCATHENLNGVDYYRAMDASKPYACRRSGDLVRFEARSGDRGYWMDAMHHNERAELVTTSAGKQTDRMYPSGRDVWLSYAFRLVSGEQQSHWAIVGQMHPSIDPFEARVPPSLALTLRPAPGGASLSLETRSDPSLISKSSPAAVGRWRGSLRTGQWVQIVLRYRADPFGHGALQAWADGREVVNLRNIPIGYNNVRDGAAWEFGIYRGQSAEPLVVEYANMEQGTQSLMNRVTNPKPLPQPAW